MTLTRRQQEVVARVARGMKQDAIGAELGISGKTVEAHKSAAVRTLKCNGTADLVRFAVAVGLVEPWTKGIPA